MSRLFLPLLILSMVFLQPSCCLAQSAQLALEEGTPVRLKLNETISTKTSTAGQKVALTVLEDVIDKDGKTVLLKEGSPAVAYLTNLDEKDGSKGGKLSIEISSVKAIDGSRIALRGTKVKSGHGGAGVGSYVVGGLLLGVIGLGVVALCGHSGSAKMASGTILTAFVDHDTTVALAAPGDKQLADKAVSGSVVPPEKTASTLTPTNMNMEITNNIPRTAP